MHILMAGVDLAHHLAHGLGQVVDAEVLDPGSGTAPPGSEKIITLVQWVMWLVLGACVVGIGIVAARMALMHQRGQGSEHASALGWVLGACILAGSASAIVQALI